MSTGDSEHEDWDAFFVGEDWEKEIYTDRGNSPDVWTLSAWKLLSVVRLLGPDVERAQREMIRIGREDPSAAIAMTRDDRVRASSVLIMLRAMAVECLLKALWIEKKGPLVKDGKFIGPKHHNLEALASQVGIELETMDTLMLRRLSLWLTVHGRYPIGSTWDADRRVRNATGSKGPICAWHPDDNIRCDDFITYLRLLRKPDKVPE